MYALECILGRPNVAEEFASEKHVAWIVCGSHILFGCTCFVALFLLRMNLVPLCMALSLEDKSRHLHAGGLWTTFPRSMFSQTSARQGRH